MNKSKGDTPQSIMIIGGGIAGTTAADRLGRSGMTVHLIEKNDAIGGRVKNMGCKATDKCMRCNICVANETFRNIINRSNITIHTSTELVGLQKGENGNRFTGSLKNGSGVQEIDTDTVVIAIGYEPYDPKENSSYKYGSIKNIITGAEVEKQLKEKQSITRASDGKEPKRTAFIQCVGSRTEEIFRRPEDTDYCSTVCCSYALRMAQRMKYQSEESEITVFYMDIQNFGKGFNALFNECKKNIRFIRSRPFEVNPLPGDKVSVRYVAEEALSDDQGKVCEEEFDLLVLSVGIRPPLGAVDMADRLSVALDDQGFFGLKGGRALSELHAEGIYAIGAGESPKDIAGSIAQAEAISASILSNL
ncbi:FAD-dependent oxidoreductase [Spirochaetota bacterium]